MLKRITLLFLFLTISHTLLTAQHSKSHLPSDANIVGHVTDAHTGEHLTGMTIQIKGTTFGTTTDATGHYFLKHLKPGKLTLIMRGVGYQSQEKEVNVKKDKISSVNLYIHRANTTYCSSLEVTING